MIFPYFVKMRNAKCEMRNEQDHIVAGITLSCRTLITISTIFSNILGGAYQYVKKEMKCCYLKHYWPDDLFSESYAVEVIFDRLSENGHFTNSPCYKILLHNRYYFNTMPRIWALFVDLMLHFEMALLKRDKSEIKGQNKK